MLCYMVEKIKEKMAKLAGSCLTVVRAILLTTTKIQYAPSKTKCSLALLLSPLHFHYFPSFTFATASISTLDDIEDSHAPAAYSCLFAKSERNRCNHHHHHHHAIYN